MSARPETSPKQPGRKGSKFAIQVKARRWRPGQNFDGAFVENAFEDLNHVVVRSRKKA